MSYNLFLDDERYPHKVTWIQLPPVEWVIVRNYKDFVDTINKEGLPNKIAFDHDLADEHIYDFCDVIELNDEIENPLKLNYNTYKEKTGYECALFVIDYMKNQNTPLSECPIIYVHSMNPIGRLNIINAFNDFYDWKRSQNTGG